MTPGHWIGHGVELIVLPTCNYIFQAPAACISLAVIAHETTESIVDNGLRVGVASIFDGTVFEEIDGYRLTTQIAGLLGIKLLVGPLNLPTDTLVSLTSTVTIGMVYDWVTGNDHDHTHTTGDSHDHEAA